MPSKDQHDKQYNHNRNLLTEIFNLDSSNNYYDWVVTIAFYSALHLVDRELAVCCYHPRTHIERDSALVRVLKHIASEYKALEIQSKRARYECVKIKKKDAERAIDLLGEIEKKIAN